MNSSDGKVRYHRKETIPMGGSHQQVMVDQLARKDGDCCHASFPAWREETDRKQECLKIEQRQWEREFVR